MKTHLAVFSSATWSSRQLTIGEDGGVRQRLTNENIRKAPLQLDAYRADAYGIDFFTTTLIPLKAGEEGGPFKRIGNKTKIHMLS